MEKHVGAVHEPPATEVTLVALLLIYDNFRSNKYNLMSHTTGSGDS
jgi:hypothetical protein